MKLLQVNIWGGRLGKQVIHLINEEKPDIICFQEAISTVGDAGLAESIEQMAAQTDLKQIFHSPVFSFHLMNKVAHFGNTIISKEPFVFKEVVFTNLEYKEGFDFDTDDYNIRNLQHAVVDIAGVKVNVLNHHGHHVKQHKNGDAQTLRQCQLIAEYIDTLEGPVVLTGDFNLSPRSESLEFLNNRLENLSISHGLKTTRTLFTPKTEVCDYIFVNDLVKVRSFEASDELVSDHKALILEFDV